MPWLSSLNLVRNLKMRQNRRVFCNLFFPADLQTFICWISIFKEIHITYHTVNILHTVFLLELPVFNNLQLYIVVHLLLVPKIFLLQIYSQYQDSIVRLQRSFFFFFFLFGDGFWHLSPSTNVTSNSEACQRGRSMKYRGAGSDRCLDICRGTAAA